MVDNNFLYFYPYCLDNNRYQSKFKNSLQKDYLCNPNFKKKIRKITIKIIIIEIDQKYG